MNDLNSGGRTRKFAELSQSRPGPAEKEKG